MPPQPPGLAATVRPMTSPWLQDYVPLHNALFATVIAALPIVVLLGSIAVLRVRIHVSALMGLGVALGIAIFVYGMPIQSAAATTLYGAAYGLFPIGWIILNLIFLYALTVKAGVFELLGGGLCWLRSGVSVLVI